MGRRRAALPRLPGCRFSTIAGGSPAAFSPIYGRQRRNSTIARCGPLIAPNGCPKTQCVFDVGAQCRAIPNYSRTPPRGAGSICLRAGKLCPLDIAQRRRLRATRQLSRSCRCARLTGTARHAVDSRSSRAAPAALAYRIFGAPQARWRSVAQEIVAQTTLDDVVAPGARPARFHQGGYRSWEVPLLRAPATPSTGCRPRLLSNCRRSTWPAPATRSKDAFPAIISGASDLPQRLCHFGGRNQSRSSSAGAGGGSAALFRRQIHNLQVKGPVGGAP